MPGGSPWPGACSFDSDAGVSLSPQNAASPTFQDYALFPHLTVRQNIAFAASRGWRNPSREKRERARRRVGRRCSCESIRLARERERARRRVDGALPPASAGRPLPAPDLGRPAPALPRWRARAGHRPAALLLDEPFAALDRRLREQLRQELLGYQTQLRAAPCCSSRTTTGHGRTRRAGGCTSPPAASGDDAGTALRPGDRCGTRGRRASHASASATIDSGTSDPRLSRNQPWVVTSAPGRTR